MLQHGLLAALLAGFEFQLAAQHVDDRAQVYHPGHRVGFAQHRAAVARRGRHRLRGGDREPGRDPGALIHRARLAQVARESGQHGQQVVGHLRAQVGLLGDHADLGVELQWVVRADLGAEAVLERGDDPATVRVVLRVGAGDHQHVQRQPQGVAAHLDVALLHHVEHGHLNALGQVGQFVDGDDAAVRPRDQSVGDGLGVTQAAAFGDLDRIDIADQVSDAGVGGGQFLGVTLAAVSPRHRQVVAEFGGPPDRLGRDWRIRMLAELGAGDHRCPLVEQPGQRAQQPGLALTAFAEQHDVVAGDQGAFQLRQHGVVEAEDAGPDGCGVVAVGQTSQQVLGDLLFDPPFAMAGSTQLTESRGQIERGVQRGHHSTLRRA